jgi:hypothetical protein
MLYFTFVVIVVYFFLVNFFHLDVKEICHLTFKSLTTTNLSKNKSITINKGGLVVYILYFVITKILKNGPGHVSVT